MNRNSLHNRSFRIILILHYFRWDLLISLLHLDFGAFKSTWTFLFPFLYYLFLSSIPMLRFLFILFDIFLMLSTLVSVLPMCWPQRPWKVCHYLFSSMAATLLNSLFISNFAFNPVPLLVLLFYSPASSIYLSLPCHFTLKMGLLDWNSTSSFSSALEALRFLTLSFLVWLPEPCLRKV